MVSGKGKFGSVGACKVCCVTMGMAGRVGVGPEEEARRGWAGMC